ncbi:MAG TPA: hypothetical protein VK907_03025 [Phnomibacter sp.]|nr:hypothetical protein [Phnomibacter sp.]
MKNFGLVILLAGAYMLAACEQDAVSLDVASQMNQAEQYEFIYSTIRYIGHLPGKANHSSKFLADFDDHYRELAKRHQLRFYGKANGEEYFIITRIAPSLTEKYVAIGGRVKFKEGTRSVEDIEEIFRTWKMPLPELLPVAEKLLREAIAGKDLSKYYPENSGDAYIIEFPNSEVRYDKPNRVWVSTREDVMEYLYRLQEQTQRDSAIADSLR